MSHEPALDEDDLAFERMLLNAGQAEALPPERTAAAWQSFAAGLAALQGGFAAAASCGAATSSRARAWLRFGAAAKWVAVGILVGGAATFGWPQPPVVSRAPSAPDAPAISPAVVPTTTTEAVPTATGEPVPVAAPASKQKSHVRSASTPVTPASKASSDLAAEVMALDGIRTALAIGATGDAEQQLASYRRRFTSGALRSEAEVLALELLLAQGQKEAVARAGERFIAQHPRDPQVMRVRALLR